jgi:hypothetical protein
MHKFRLLKTSSRCFAALMVFYLFLYGLMLFATNGMPYTTDNNESYSSLVHAQSLSQFGITKSMGLADEALGLSPDAHPYVHSHQGNYPRIFAWIIYELGATTPSSQIVVTTFTVGLAAICLAFAFFSTIANPVFALLICLVYLTDYVFFSQWQVVTYRVWYAFVFFLQFYAVEKVLSSNNRYWLFLLAANTALFMYGELIFAAFLGIASFVWLLVRGWRKPKTVFWSTICLAVGVISAVALLMTQGIAFLGAEDFLRDLRLTFGARNEFDGGSLSISEIAAFYRDHNVIFWENMQGRDGYIGLVPFIRSLLQSFVQAYSPLPFICFLVFIITWVIAQFIPRGGLIWPVPLLSVGDSCIFRKGISYVLVSMVAFGLIAATIHVVSYYYGILALSPALVAAELVVVVCLLALVAGNFRYHMLLVLATAAIAIGALPRFFDKEYVQLWLAMHGDTAAPQLVWLVPGASILAIAWLTRLIKQEPVERNQHCLRTTFQFLMVGLGAYALVYHLSPGYVHSGYVKRYAPFFVYFLDVVVAIPVFMVITTTRESWARIRSDDRYSTAATINFILGGVVLVGLGWLWFGIQYASVRLMPPGHFEVLHKISDTPYKNSSFAVNGYAGPVGAQTRQWAYFDTGIGNAEFTDIDGVQRLVGDRRYLWLADRETNPAYLRPDYFLCLYNQDPKSVLTNLLRRAQESAPPYGCSSLPLVKLASSNQPVSGLTLVDIDTEGLKTIGYATWAIVKFDWDNGLGGGLTWRDELSANKRAKEPNK